MRSEICTYSVNISAGGALFLVTQIVTIENECKRLVFKPEKPPYVYRLITTTSPA